MNFIDRTVESFVGAMEHAFYAEDLAQSRGLLQSTDPRLKILTVLALVIASVLARRLWIIAAFFVVALILAAISHVPFRLLLRRVWIPVLLFTGAMALLAPFITPGRTLFRLPLLGPVSEQGLLGAAYLFFRAETAAALCILVVLTTPWAQVLKALRALLVPSVVVLILSMTYRYIFLLLLIARDMFIGHRARLVGALGGPERRKMATASAGVLLSKSLHLSSDVFLAMRSRGFAGEAYALDDFRTRPRDWGVLAAAAMLLAATIWFGR